jgi:hypothetical protein
MIMIPSQPSSPKDLTAVKEVELLERKAQPSAVAPTNLEGLLNRQIESNIKHPRKKLHCGPVIHHLTDSKKALQSSPGNWNVSMVDTTVAPYNGNPLCYAGQGFYQNYYLDQQFVLGYFNLASTPYTGANQLVVFVMDPSNWPVVTWGPADTTVRFILPVLQGQVPCVAVPKGTALEPGLTWEKTCYTMGWWNQDPPGVTDPMQIPPGPNWGQAFLMPNILLAIWALTNGVSDWWDY